jgi:outer membrane biosynthesis protein TonB
MIAFMRTRTWLLWAGLAAVGCAKGTAPAPSGAAPSVAAPSVANPEFDKQWAALAHNEVDVFYIEDDRGEGLMGNVRRARHEQNLALAARPSDPGGSPQVLSNDDMQRVIRQNLPGVRACFLRIARDGDQRSGKAIVSFHVGPQGDVQDTKVEAPSFQGTSLPNCVSGTVSHWAFPKSQKGGLAISYPFVFVGG